MTIFTLTRLRQGLAKIPVKGSGCYSVASAPLQRRGAGLSLLVARLTGCTKNELMCPDMLVYLTHTLAIHFSEINCGFLHE